MAQDNNPFADLVPQRQAVPGYIPGRPKPISPIEAQRLELSERADLRAERGAARADAAAIRAAEAAERQAAVDARKLTEAAKTTESERKASAFLTRALGSNVQYEAQGVGPRSLIGQGIANTAPNLLNSLPGFIGNSAERQVADTAQDEFIAASLRQDSGAAIPEEEMDRQRRIYFPMPGDGPEAIAAKAEARRRAIQGLVQSAGAGLDPKLRDQYPQYFGGEAPVQDRGSLVFNDQLPDKTSKSYRLTPAQELAVNSALMAGGSAEAVADLYNQFGHPADEVTMDALRKAVEFYRTPANRGLAPTHDYSRVDAITPVDPGTEGLGNGAFGAAARGVGDTVSLGFLDEIKALTDTVGSGGTYAENLDRRRGQLLWDEQNHGGARLAGQVAGGFALPTGRASGVRQLALLGAGYGGAYGVGSANGGFQDRAVGGGLGALLGAGLGAVGGGIGERLASRLPPNTPPSPGRSLMEAAQRQGIDVLPADVGGTMTRRMTAGVAQTPFGSGPIAAAAETAQNQAAGRLAQVAASEGAALRTDELGDFARTAAEGYINRTGAESRAAYDAARAGANDLMHGRRAFQNLNSQIRELGETPSTSAPLINGLERIRADIAGEEGLRPLTIDAIRRLRTNVRAEAQTEALRSTDYQRRAGQVLDELSEDIASQLPPEAAARFRAADQAYRERLDTIDNVITEVIGPEGARSAEQVANRLIGMTRTDSNRLGRFMGSLNEQEAGTIRGSLIQEMGRANSGAQNADGTAFSLQTFLTNWDKLPERSKRLLFRGENRQVMDDLARVAEGARATRSYANTSGTAGATNASRLVSGAGSTVSAIGALSSLGSSVVLENLTGRLLASRRFAQWLARPTRTPAERASQLRRLTAIATREPQIANDIIPFRQALEQGSRAAASDQEQDVRPK